MSAPSWMAMPPHPYLPPARSIAGPTTTTNISGPTTTVNPSVVSSNAQTGEGSVQPTVGAGGPQGGGAGVGDALLH